MSSCKISSAGTVEVSSLNFALTTHIESLGVAMILASVVDERSMSPLTTSQESNMYPPWGHAVNWLVSPMW